MSDESFDEARLRELAGDGHVQAMSMLGYVLQQSKWTRAEGHDWWRRAAREGDVDSMERLGAAGVVDLEERQQWKALARVTRRGAGSEPVPDEVAEAAAGAHLGRCTLYFPREHEFNQRPAIWLFERGFVSQWDPAGARVGVFPWGRSRVRESRTRHMKQGQYMKTTYRYVVTRDDGLEVQIAGDSVLSGEIWVLGEGIVEGTRNTRRPRAVAALQAGGRLDFGPLSVDLSGIYDRQDFLPWSQVRELLVRRGNIVIKKWRFLAWSRYPLSEIPDLQVLLGLIEGLYAPPEIDH